MTTLLTNGTIVDGSGRPSFEGHVLLDGDRIAGVFRSGEETPAAAVRIDATGRAIAPGFVDMHSHADFLVPEPDQVELTRGLLEQGVTTIIAGNCGISPAPIEKARLDRLTDFASIAIDAPLSFAWTTMSEYLDAVAAARPAVNVAQLVGHGSLRHAGAETRRGALPADERQRCLDLTCESLEQGACGLSFGLGYDPGMYSPLDELEAFSKVAARAGKPVTSHLKAYSRLSPCYPLTYFGAHNLRAVDEMLDVATRAGARLQISHLIFVGRSSWSSCDEAIRRIDEARNRGLDVAFDAFPYTCGNTTILAPFPYWFLALGEEGYRSRWARVRLRAELEIGFRFIGFMYVDLQVMAIGVPEWEDLNGLTIAEIAPRWSLSPFDTLLRIAERSRGSAMMLYHAYSGDREGKGPIESVLTHEACLFETDSIVRSKGWANPAAVGTFPKILGDLVRNQKRLSLEAAVHRMTQGSTARFNLGDRGLVEKGKIADIVVFDPATIADDPPSDHAPYGRPKGIEHVFVNGVHAVIDGVFNPEMRAGRVLRT